MNIVYCTDCIRGLGGIQRVTTAKASALAGIPGNRVWILVADTSGRSLFPCSPEVQVMDLGIHYYEDDWKSKWHVLKGILLKRRLHRKRLKDTLHKIRPDIVISVGQSEKNILPGIRGPWKTVREYHFARDYRRAHAASAFEKILAVAGDLYERVVTLRKYDRIVVLTHEDRDSNWRGRDRVCVIPNPVIMDPQLSDLSSRRIIAVGRLERPKDFASLIRSFARVHEAHPDWELSIFGEGSQRELLLSLIDGLNLRSAVSLKGTSKQISVELAASSILAVSSKHEGQPLALLEAMSCGLPVVAYACPCGPKDIITDGENGYLVTPGDEAMLAQRMCQLIEDVSFRRRMGKAARERAEDFSMGSILPQWVALFRELNAEA